MKLSNRQIKRELDRVRRDSKTVSSKALEKLQAEAEQMTAEEWRNWFNGVDVVKMRLTGTRQVRSVKRRAVDARLWRAMTPEQSEAAIDIGRALEIITAGIGYRTNKFIFSHGGAHETHEWQLQLIKRYLNWAREAQRQKLDIFAVISVLTMGDACSVVDRNRSKRNGWAKDNLFGALDVYCEM